jgi:hypothetical protein
MIAKSHRLTGACPVAAIVADLAHVIALQNAPLAAGAEVDHHRAGVLADRERALLAVAETSRANSIQGAALQVVLTGYAAGDMGAGLISRNADGCDRNGDELDRASEAMTRSAYAALAGCGGELPQVIVERFMPLECDVWATLAAAGEVLRAA